MMQEQKNLLEKYPQWYLEDHNIEIDPNFLKAVSAKIELPGSSD